MGLDFGGLLSNMLNSVARYWWIIAIIGGFIIFIGIAYWLSRIKKKKTQWTHNFKVRRLLQNGTLTPEIVHKARRFPLEKGVEIFELQKPILGSYLMPQPGEYTGINEFAIILDSYNRVYLNKGYHFNKDKQSIDVSAVHAGIDVEMANMKDKWQQAHKVEKRITTAELIKAGIKIIAIIAIVILGITALKQWGEAQQYKAQSDQALADAMQHINEAVQTMEKVVNTQQLQIIPMLEALYGKDNIANEINKYRVENITDIAK
jgi:hypothetical protein